MLDTIKFRIDETPIIDVSKAKNLKINRTFDLETGEYQEYPLAKLTNGDVLSGTKAFYNSDICNLDLTGFGNFVRFSIPKVYNKDNLYPVGKESTKIVFKIVRKHLLENGISIPSLNSDVAIVSRIDLFNNALTVYPFDAYRQVFEVLAGKRVTKRDYGTTFNYGNKQRQLTCYDKVEEMKIANKDTGELGNILRGEYKLLTGKAVKSHSRLTTGNNIIKHWDTCKDVYKRGLEGLLLTYEDIQEAKSYAGHLELERLKSFAEKGGHFVNNYLKVVGIVNMLELFGGWQGIEGALNKVMKNKQSLSNQMKKLRGAYLNHSDILDKNKQIPVSELYQELKTKWLA